MNKNFVKCFFIIALVFGFTTKLKTIKAAELTTSLTGFYWDRRGGGHEWSGSFKYYYLDGVDSYCLDPYTHEGGPMYESDQSPKLPDHLKQRILLIAYYGYNYPSHQTLQYRAATQALIWETVTGHEVRFFDRRYGEGNELNISSERNEIERLISNHYVKPSFNGEEYRIQVGEQLIIEDTNSVLSNYDVVLNSENIKLNGNQLIINQNDTSNTNIILRKKEPYSSPYKIFVSEVYQHQLVPGYTDPSVASLKINPYYGKLDITKKDNENVSAQGNASLNGAKYGVYKVDNDELIATITTDEFGNATTDSILRYGEYYVKEIEASNGYQLDDTKYYVDLKGKEEVHIDVLEKVIKGKIKIKKYDSETTSCVSQGQSSLVGAKYQVLDIHNNVVDTLVIGDDCTSISKSLPYGQYKIKEIEAPKGYELDNNIYTISINNHNQVIEVISKEKAIKNYISILKQYDYVDGTTQFLNAEANIKFEIYDDKNELYDTIITDKNGYATIEIPYGVWKFHQVNTNTNFEKIYDFYITVDKNSEKEQYYNILNNKLSAYLQVIKQDSETGETIAIADTTFKILNLDTNQYVSQYVAGKVISEFKTDTNGKMITYLKLESGNYKLVEVSSPNGYLIDNDGLNFTIGDNTYFNYTTYGAFITVYYKNSPIKGQVEINKTGEVFVVENESYYYDEKSLAGIEFEIYADGDILSSDGNYLYYHDGDIVDKIVTDDNGYAISSKLPLGNYYIKETKTLEDYVLDDTIFSFSLTEVNNKTEVVYKSVSKLNHLKKGTVEFTKTDFIDNNAIPNTLMELYTENNELIFKGRTDEEGKIIIKDLRIGRYYFIEKEASNGYLLNEDKLWFEIKEDGEVVKSNMKDERVKGMVNIHKDGESYSVVDSCDDSSNCFVYEIKRNLKGIHFGLYAKEDIILNNIKRYSKGDLVTDGYTDEFGNLLFTDLYLGNYIVKELDTIDNYVLDTKEYEVDLQYVDFKTSTIEKSFILKNYLIKADYEFTKTDLVNDNPLPNTLMEIYFEDGTLIYRGYTDENGQIILKNMPSAKYYILEKEAPEGYILNEEPMYFEIKEDGKIIKSSMKDEKIKSTIIIHKIDQNGKSLSGVTIGIYDLEENLIYQGVTDENGNIELTLEYGKYYFQEIATIDGYVLSDEKIYFDVIENDTVIENTLVNIDVPNALSNTCIIQIGSLIITVGIGLILISSKNNKKKH